MPFNFCFAFFTFKQLTWSDSAFWLWEPDNNTQFKQQGAGKESFYYVMAACAGQPGTNVTTGCLLDIR